MVVAVDPSELAQPVEVRPEMSPEITAEAPVTVSEKTTDEKPKRAPVRRKPRVKKEEAAAPKTEEIAE